MAPARRGELRICGRRRVCRRAGRPEREVRPRQRRRDSVNADHPEGEEANPVYSKFEAFVLQMFVETMLPKDAEDVFGKGAAAAYLAFGARRQIAQEMAKGNRVGIAKRLAEIGARHRHPDFRRLTGRSRPMTVEIDMEQIEQQTSVIPVEAQALALA